MISGSTGKNMALNGKARKWIDRRIAALDPAKDYAEIMCLSVVYRSNDAFMDLLYSITFPNFIVPNRGAIAVLRDGKGKVFRAAERRMDDTARHILIWNEFGPEHEYTRRSVNALNRLHKHWSDRYPGSFAHDEDYLYTMCYEATLFHRLLRRVGLAGLSEKEKQASWEFYSRLAPQFRNAETDTAISGFPGSFEACVDYVERYESTRWPPNAYTASIDATLIQAFAKRHMPKVLRPIGRQLVLSLLPERTVCNLGLELPPPFVRKLCKLVFATYLLIGMKLLRDPTQSHAEIIREREGLSVEQYVLAVTG
ncbi:oxygenase MpaB family protein [Alteraurantiacibacter buctensis]|uniref:ER-bound oxygenase mpaB/mpaB'/Rubber oxygenase catalytic domain-containing protein n=1 Tax=Alteraurantiacibacter buctensis TaxID=1503981 RepID=A0A844Z1K2_9SPHN|nr:oxygenase MpaB family protein [Alteraurantiacibacter buctensis]MXO73030.1 hypothetical protein [Alteraurantiacibacter buctensis]